MGSHGKLPTPKSIGSNGYVWSAGFPPASPEVRPNFPSIWIDPVMWLEHTLSYFGVQQVTKECSRVSDVTWKGRVQFTMPRRKDSDHPLYFAAAGIRAVSQSLGYKYVVTQSLKLLDSVGYNIPSYSSMIMQAMDHQGLFYDVEENCLLIAQGNRTSPIEDSDMTYAACSFEATFDQVMDACGHDWKYAYASPRLTTEGYQDKLVASRKASAGAPSFIVVSRPCRRPAEATESVLCTALSYISLTYGYIGDLDYAQFIVRRTQLLN